MKFLHLLSFALSLTMMSCSGQKLVTTRVAYQSVRVNQQKNPDLAKNAEILVGYGIGSGGQITGVIYNRTNEIMIIDQTMTFFINTNGTSTSYYDPTIRQTTVTDMSSGTTGASVNLGAIGSALGIGGPVGTLLNGVNVGGSSTDGQSVSNTTIKADLPRVSIGPKGSATLSKAFNIKGIGTTALDKADNGFSQYDSIGKSPLKFSVCISYSVDGGETFKKLVTEMYLNSQIIVPISDSSKINDSMRQIYSMKPDAVNESWWLMYVPNNQPTFNNRFETGSLVDFQ